MSILLPQRWRQQPPYRTDIDWSNPLAKRLRLAQTSSGGLVDLVNQWPATKSTSDEIRGVNIPRLGPAVSFKGARATGGGINFGQVQAVKTDTITVLILANPNTTQAQTVFSQRTSSSPFNQFSFAVNSNDSLLFSSGKIAAVCLTSSGGGRHSVSAGSAFTDAGWHVYVATFSGAPAYPTIYYDGASVAVNNTQTGTGTWVSSNQHTRIGNIADYTTDANYAASCDIPLCLVWDRVLSADEVRQISANPWQLFQPIRGIPVAFDTGGGAQTLTPSLYTNNQTFYSPTVTPGAVTLSPSLYTNQQTFYGPTVVLGPAPQTLTPSLYTNTQTFYSPTVIPEQFIEPGLYTNQQVFYGPTVTQVSPQTIYPGLFVNENQFFPFTVQGAGGGATAKGGWATERRRLELSIQQRQAQQTLAQSKDKVAKKIAKRIERFVEADFQDEIDEIVALQKEFAKLEARYNNSQQLSTDLRDATKVLQEFIQDEQDAIDLLMLVQEFDARCVIEATASPDVASLMGSA